MKLTEIITLIATLLTAGWASMYLTQLIKQASWPSGVKLILAVVIAGLVGIATAWLSGDVLGITAKWGHLTAADVLAFGGIVYASAATWFKVYYQGTKWMNSVEAFPVKKATP